ncbi:MAG: D-2-hydroxyacid dehydrogenase [Blautia sp.]|jgi:lactate dehydrogenase-like 2-hydroxyacid dehydrogenase
MKIVILEAGALGEDVDFSVFDRFGEVVRYEKSTPKQVPERIRDAQVVIANKVPVCETYFGQAQALELVCVTATGINNLDLDFLKERGIPACNVAGYSTGAVAQHTFALLFYIWQKLRYYDDFVKSGEYAKGEAFSHFGKKFYELDGKTWGIVGLGAIGRKVAEIASVFGCRVLVYSASGSRYDSPYEQVDFDTLLAESDILSIHAPLNESTRNLMTLDAFQKMKRSAVLINVARGPIVNEQDLYTALTQDLIAGAALDVLSREPMREDNPLGKIMDSSKLVITPHIAWAPVETRNRVVEEVAANIQAFLDGHIRNRVC